MPWDWGELRRGDAGGLSSLLRCRITVGSMLDAVHMQRSAGVARVSIDGGRLAGLTQSGSAKALLPRSYGPAPEVVFLNTSGGLTSGDTLDYQLDLGPATRATAPLRPADDAVHIDSTDLTLDEVVDLVAGLVPAEA